MSENLADVALEYLANHVFERVARRHKVRSSLLRAKIRETRVARAREEAYFAVKDATGWDGVRIARFFDRHQSTVNYALAKRESAQQVAA